MKIITLIENQVNKAGLLAEHGLCIYIDTGTQKILFDTGQTNAFIKNAEKLGVDLSEVDSVVISHGHFNHMGGLPAFLELNSKARVFLKKEALNHKFSNGSKSMEPSIDLDKHKDRLEFVTQALEIAEGVFIMSEIPIIDETDTNFQKCKVTVGENITDDKFPDELFLAITRKNKLSILSSCSHRGITNIIREAKVHFNLPIKLILGGFHFKEFAAEQYVNITYYLNQIEPETIGICHCTSMQKYADLANDCHTNVMYNFTGNTIRL